MADSPVFGFGPFVLHSVGRQLFLAGNRIHLTPKPGAVLLLLVSRAPETVPREDVKALWQRPDVADDVVSFQVGRLRTILREGIEAECIETVAGEGYRFTVPVQRLEGPSGPEPERIPSWRVAYRWIAGIVAAGLIGVVGYLATRHFATADSVPRVIETRQLTRDGTAKIGWPIFAAGRRLHYFIGTRSGAMTLSLPDDEPRPFLTGGSDYWLEDFNTERAEYLAFKLPGTSSTAEPTLWSIAAASGAPRRIGDLECSAAAWSPDGRSLVVFRQKKLEIVLSNGTRIRSLPTPPDGAVSWLRWSPDGQLIRFSWASPRPRKVHRQKIWEVRPDGTGLRALPLGEDDRLDCCGAWTPDGQWFIYQSAEAGATELRIVGEAGSSRPMRLTADSLNFAGPAISPDGTTVYAVGWPVLGELVFFDVEQGGFGLTLPEISGLWVSYAPDGKHIAFVGYPERKLWRARIDGGDKRLLVDGAFEIDGSSWSPDGRTIAFRSAMGGSEVRIFTVSPDGGNARPISDQDRAQGVPSWSPDGRKLVFGDVPAQFGKPDGKEALWIHDLDKRTSVELSGSRRLGLWTPRWAPDNGHIAAVSILEPRRIHLFNFATKSWRVLPLTERVDDLQWTRDGQSIIYRTEGKPTLQRVRISDGRVELLTDLSKFPFAPEAYSWFGLTPDDAPLLLRNRGATEIYALTIKR